MQGRERYFVLFALAALGCGSNVSVAPEQAALVDSGEPADATTVADAESPDTSAESEAEAAPPCIPGPTACSNCIDDDGDGLIDGLDRECTGPSDNDEKTFGLGVPDDPCRPGCAFDGVVGPGDPCTTEGRCISGTTDASCAYDEKAASDPRKCPGWTDACREYCMPKMPDNCDCFGCCDIKTGPETSVSVKLTSTCTYDALADETRCPRCTTTLCRRCPGSYPACSPTKLCKGVYCLFGCCVPVD